MKFLTFSQKFRKIFRHFSLFRITLCLIQNNFSEILKILDLWKIIQKFRLLRIAICRVWNNCNFLVIIRQHNTQKVATELLLLAVLALNNVIYSHYLTTTATTAAIGPVLYSYITGLPLLLQYTAATTVVTFILTNC